MSEKRLRFNDYLKDDGNFRFSFQAVRVRPVQVGLGTTMSLDINMKHRSDDYLLTGAK